MPFSPRKEEVEAVMFAIEDCKTLEEVARVALKESYAVMQRRGGFAVVTDTHLVYAPFPSEADAYTALSNARIPDFDDPEGVKNARAAGVVPTLGGRAAVMPTVGPLAAAEASIEADRKAKLFANHQCAEPGCGHKLARHNDKTGKCPVKTCGCQKPVPVKL